MYKFKWPHASKANKWDPFTITCTVLQHISSVLISVSGSCTTSITGSRPHLFRNPLLPSSFQTSTNYTIRWHGRARPWIKQWPFDCKCDAILWTTAMLTSAVSAQLTSSQKEHTLLRSVKLPVTLQTDDVREQLAKADLGEDNDMLLHTAHCCTLSQQPNCAHTHC